MGITAIPISEIKAYFDIFKIDDPELRYLYLTFIKSLDGVFCTHINKKS